jgi:hypothetical protein
LTTTPAPQLRLRSGGSGSWLTTGGSTQERADRERQRIASWNNEVQRISDQMTLGDHDALREYFTAALCASRGSFR